MAESLPVLSSTKELEYVPSLSQRDTKEAAKKLQITGLSQVYPDPGNISEATKILDVIILHGLSTRSSETFIAYKVDGDSDSGDVNWLTDSSMLPAVMPEARILTYDWNASYDSFASSDIFHGHARTLLDRVYVNRKRAGRSKYPIIFVASCFGGLLLAKALVLASFRHSPRGDKYVEILHHTVGAAFLGTPFRGSWPTGYSVAQLRIAVAKSASDEDGIEYSRELPEFLRRGTVDDPSPLDELVTTFTELIHSDDSKFPVVCVYETRHTKFSAAIRTLPRGFVQNKINVNGHGIVVGRYSACLPGVDSIALDCRHNMLQKFNSPDNDGFVRLTDRLVDYAEAAEETLRKKRRF